MIAVDVDWSQSHCGVILCTREQTVESMPEVEPILDDLYGERSAFWNDKLIDVKVHMLMPGQFPCIPNWHRDFMPRDLDGKRIRAKAAPDLMYAWMSGPPLTEYRVGNQTKKWTPREWHRFTQATVHRGTASAINCWRCFIRVIPHKFVHPTSAHLIGQQRRHSQVYVDSKKFTW